VEAFHASNTVHAVVRELVDAGPVVDAAVQGGANSVSGPVFRLADPRAHYEAAVDAAYEDARFRAEAIAARAGVALGGPVAIVEGGGAVPLPRSLAVQSAEAVSVPLEPGLQEVTVVLTVTFARPEAAARTSAKRSRRPARRCRSASGGTSLAGKTSTASSSPFGLTRRLRPA
jgi:uncharacterized protein YggE